MVGPCSDGGDDDPSDGGLLGRLPASDAGSAGIRADLDRSIGVSCTGPNDCRRVRGSTGGTGGGGGTGTEDGGGPGNRLCNGISRGKGHTRGGLSGHRGPPITTLLLPSSCSHLWPPRRLCCSCSRQWILNQLLLLPYLEPLLDIPTVRHFFNRQDLQEVLFFLLMTHWLLFLHSDIEC